MFKFKDVVHVLPTKTMNAETLFTYIKNVVTDEIQSSAHFNR